MQPEPEFFQAFNEVFEADEIDRFDVVTVGAEPVREVHVLFLARGAEHDDGQEGQVRMLAQPPQHIEPIAQGHFDIEQDQPRKRIFFPVPKLFLALQVFHGHGAIGDDLSWRIDTQFIKGALEEKNIFVAVISDKYMKL